MSRVWPQAAQSLRQHARATVDRWAGDAGNFERDHLSLLRRAVDEAQLDMQIDSIHWSGENHHAGRADGAIRITEELARLQSEDATGRTLLLGHSHGGNVMALASQLWGCSPADWKAFLHAGRTIYRSPFHRLNGWLNRIDQPKWEWALDLRRPPNVDGQRCWLVTLGTPVRYGWGRVGKLLHFVHRPSVATPDVATCFQLPPVHGDAAWGDVIQQLGIAGTNFPPSWVSFRARLADRRLGRILQPRLRRRDMLRRLRKGVCLHDQGENLLVDYQSADQEADDLWGHAVYTRTRWLAFHFSEIARRWAPAE